MFQDFLLGHLPSGPGDFAARFDRRFPITTHVGVIGVQRRTVVGLYQPPVETPQPQGPTGSGILLDRSDNPERPIVGKGLKSRKPFTQTTGAREQVHHPDLRIDSICHPG